MHSLADAKEQSLRPEESHPPKPGFAQALGSKLRLIREDWRISQAKAADALGIAQSDVAGCEAGERSISRSELTGLGKLYSIPLKRLVEVDDSACDWGALGPLFSDTPSLKKDPVARKQIADMFCILSEAAWLKCFLDHDEPLAMPSYGMNLPGNARFAIAHGEKAAAEERRRLALGDAPIGNMAHLLNSQGIWAFGCCLPEGISSVSTKHESIGRAVIVNARHSVGRRRLSYARHYAHAVLDRSCSSVISETGEGCELEDVRAIAFAAAFLMPAQGITEFLRGHDLLPPSWHQQSMPGAKDVTYVDFANVASHYGVSYKDVLNRLADLQYLQLGSRAHFLGREAEARSFLRMLHLPEPDAESHEDSVCASEMKSAVAVLAVESHQKGNITFRRMLEHFRMLGMDDRSFYH